MKHLDTIQTTSLDLVLADVFDSERCCEQPTPECSNLATWWRVPPCGCAVRAVCDSHKRGNRPHSTGGQCFTCGAFLEWVDIRWEPIR